MGRVWACPHLLPSTCWAADSWPTSCSSSMARLLHSCRWVVVGVNLHQERCLAAPSHTPSGCLQPAAANAMADHSTVHSKEWQSIALCWRDSFLSWHCPCSQQQRVGRPRAAALQRRVCLHKPCQPSLLSVLHHMGASQPRHQGAPLQGGGAAAAAAAAASACAPHAHSCSSPMATCLTCSLPSSSPLRPGCAARDGCAALPVGQSHFPGSH